MLRISWLTNNAAPYRRPMWEYIGDRAKLEVDVLESDRALLRRSRRPAEWTVASAQQEAKAYRIRRIASFAVGRGERLFHTALVPPVLGNAPDAVLIGGWDSPAYWQALTAARLRGVRAVGFYESTLASQRHSAGVVGKARNFFFRQLGAVVVPGMASREAVLSMGVGEGRIHVGFNSVDVGAFQRPDGLNAPQAPGHRFIYVGQLIDRKNVADMISAFDLIREPHDSLTIVGAGPQEVELKALAESRELVDSVSFEGAVAYASLPEKLWDHHTLILPSSEEVWGLVVNEALAAGLHAVVSEYAGVAASVRNQQGVFVAEPSVVALAAAMELSRSSWKGPITDPEILRYTPERFAEVFLGALAGSN